MLCQKIRVMLILLYELSHDVVDVPERSVYSRKIHGKPFTDFRRFSVP